MISEEEVISSAVSRLDDLLTMRSGSMRGSVEEMRGLRYDLTSMQAFLTDSTRRARYSLIEQSRQTDLISELNEIANSIRRICCIADNVGGGEWFDPYPDHVDRLNISIKEIMGIRYRLEVYRSKCRAWRAEAPAMRPEFVVRQQGLPAPWPGQENVVVGMEEDVRLLLDKAILNGVPGLYTCCITGMGGIGKTTLARKLYYHSRVVWNGFERRAWVCLSGKTTLKEIMIEILRQLVRNSGANDEVDNMKLWDETELRDRLHDHLEGKRYFIVLDDGEAHHWDSALGAFPHNGDLECRLLLTSRTRISMIHAQYIHPMKILDHDKSWELFLKTVFKGYGRNYKCPSHLKIIGEQVVRKCNGLPLAIKEAGWRMSIKKHTASEWEEYLQSMDLSFTSAVLESSCDRLPLELRSCFLSLAFFKERTTIRAEKLVHVWTMAGMISQEEEKYETAEGIARRYIHRLAIEYMVVIKDMTKDHLVKNIHMNDNLHRLSVAKAKEEIGFEIIRNDARHCQASGGASHRVVFCSRGKFKYSRNTQDKQHLLSLFFCGGRNLDKFEYPILNDRSIVSLFFHGGGNIDSYLRLGTKLKILDLEGFGLETFPAGQRIDRLIELRYLGLRNNYIKELPRALANMKKLEVLDIAHNFMVKVPYFIWEMHSLRHLYMSDAIFPEGMGVNALDNLETLIFIAANRTDWFFRPERTARLRKLGIQDMDENSNVRNLCGLTILESLILRGFRYRRMPELRKLPSLDKLTQLKVDGLLNRLHNSNFPINLSYLTLVNTCLDEDPMPILENLEKLFYLKLRNAYTGWEMAISRWGFTELGVLDIEELWHLRNLRVVQGALWKLERLEIYSCPYLETIPAEILLGNNMQELKMVTTRRIARKLRAIERRLQRKAC